MTKVYKNFELLNTETHLNNSPSNHHPAVVVPICTVLLVIVIVVVAFFCRRHLRGKQLARDAVQYCNKLSHYAIYKYTWKIRYLCIRFHIHAHTHTHILKHTQTYIYSFLWVSCHSIAFLYMCVNIQFSIKLNNFMFMYKSSLISDP